MLMFLMSNDHSSNVHISVNVKIICILPAPGIGTEKDDNSDHDIGDIPQIGI